MKHDKPRVTGEDQKLSEATFKERFHRQFCDEHFRMHDEALEMLAQIAWENYRDGRKAPGTKKAGVAYTDPDYELSEDWLKTKKAIDTAEEEYVSPASPSRVLLIQASDRNENTCPGEMPKSKRLVEIAQKSLTSEGIIVDVLDLSTITSEYGKTIYPCKGCVSTAMPLCHWPCSCYPHHSLGQSHDWMNEIYPLWVRAHGIMIVTPVYWHQAPSALKLMIDRLVCADGGNPDPTSTQGKKAEIAKKIEIEGWHYPKHLAGRLFSVIVHGDAVGVNELKNALSEWLQEMELIPAGLGSTLGRYIGYYENYAESHEALDRDLDFQAEVRNAALALSAALKAKREGKLNYALPHLHEPRPK